MKDKVFIWNNLACRHCSCSCVHDSVLKPASNIALWFFAWQKNIENIAWAKNNCSSFPDNANGSIATDCCFIDFQWFIWIDYFEPSIEGAIVLTNVKVQPSDRSEEAKFGVGGLHSGWIFYGLWNQFWTSIQSLFSVSIWKRKQASSKLNVVRYNCKTFTIDTLDTRSWNQVKTDNKVWNLSQSTSNKIQLLLKYFNTKLSFESYNMPVGWNSKSPALNSFE